MIIRTLIIFGDVDGGASVAFIFQFYICAAFSILAVSIGTLVEAVVTKKASQQELVNDDRTKRGTVARVGQHTVDIVSSYRGEGVDFLADRRR